MKSTIRSPVATIQIYICRPKVPSFLKPDIKSSPVFDSSISRLADWKLPRLQNGYGELETFVCPRLQSDAQRAKRGMTLGACFYWRKGTI